MSWKVNAQHAITFLPLTVCVHFRSLYLSSLSTSADSSPAAPLPQFTLWAALFSRFSPLSCNAQTDEITSWHSPSSLGVYLTRKKTLNTCFVLVLFVSSSSFNPSCLSDPLMVCLVSDRRKILPTAGAERRQEECNSCCMLQPSPPPTTPSAFCSGSSCLWSWCEVFDPVVFLSGGARTREETYFLLSADWCAICLKLLQLAMIYFF